jgi:hypothetical protein
MLIFFAIISSLAAKNPQTKESVEIEAEPSIWYFYYGRRVDDFGKALWDRA